MQRVSRKFNFFSGIGSYHDSISWLYESSNFNIANKKPILAFWLHTHVRGSLCGFSSVDVHTQYAYRLIAPQVLGGVIQLEHDGSCQNYDFFELTSAGNKAVGKCGKTMNLSSIQHESCASEDFYASVQHRIVISDDILVNVHDFRSEEPDQTFVWSYCKNCKKEFKNILLHLSKSNQCKKTYGKEFEKMKEFKANEKKKYIKDYSKKNAENIRKRKLEYMNLNREKVNAKKRKCDSEHREERLEKHRTYNEENREQIISKQRLFNKENHEKNTEKQKIYDEIHRKVYNENNDLELFCLSCFVNFYQFVTST